MALLFQWNGTDLSQFDGLEALNGGASLAEYTVSVDTTSFPAQSAILIDHPAPATGYTGLYFLPVKLANFTATYAQLIVRAHIWQTSGSSNSETFGIALLSSDRTGFTVTEMGQSNTSRWRALESGMSVGTINPAGLASTNDRPGFVLSSGFVLENGPLTGYPDGMIRRHLAGNTTSAVDYNLVSTIGGVTPANWVGKTLDTVGIVVDYPNAGNDPASVWISELSIWTYPGFEGRTNYYS